MQTNHFRCVCISIVDEDCTAERRFVPQVKWSPSLYSCKTHWHKCVTTCFVGLKREISVAISAISTEVAKCSTFTHHSLSKCKATWTWKVTFTVKYCATVRNVSDALLQLSLIFEAKPLELGSYYRSRWHWENLNLTELKCGHIKFKSHTAFSS